MTHSIIKKTQLEGALRIDAEYYQPEYLELNKILDQQQSLSLDNFIDYITDGAHKTPNYQEKGVLFLSSGLIHENYIDFDEAKFISESEDRILKHCKPKINDILISKSGKIGVATVFNENENCNLFEGVALIRTTKLNPYFLSIFLNSKYGQRQIKRLIIGISQPHLHLEQIKKIQIPEIFRNDQKEIEKIYNNSFQQIQLSERFYQQAEDLLLEKLDLKDFEINNEISNVVNLSDVKSANRIDAEYFQKKYAKLILALKKLKSKSLSDVIISVPAEFNPKIEPEKEFNYIELANINSLSGSIDGANTVIGKEAPSRAKRILKENDIIVSSVEGSLEKVALVNENYDGCLASTGFFQLRSKQILPEYLLILAKSIVFQYQLQQRCAGTILTAVPQDSIQNILVPILPKSAQQKIADLVKKSHHSRQKSKELLEKAKRKVEEIIEKKI